MYSMLLNYSVIQFVVFFGELTIGYISGWAVRHRQKQAPEGERVEDATVSGHERNVF